METALNLKDLIHQVLDSARPRIVIEDGHHWVFATPVVRSAQSATEDLRDEQLAIKGSFFVRHDLKNVLRVPTLVEHRHRDDPLHFARWAIYVFEPRHVRLML